MFEQFRLSGRHEKIHPAHYSDIGRIHCQFWGRGARISVENASFEQPVPSGEFEAKFMFKFLNNC